jgi:hypothetical protein
MKTIHKVATIFMILVLLSTVVLATTLTISPTTKQTVNQGTTLNDNVANPNVNYNAIPVATPTAVSTTKQSVIAATTVPVAYSATFGMIDTKTHSFGSSGWVCNRGLSSCWQSITSYSFNLPYNSYVAIESSGVFENYEGMAGVALGIDQSNPCQWDKQTYRIYTSDEKLANGQISTGFQTSRTYYLTKGTHTIYLDGLATRNITDPNIPDVSAISITAIANSVGSLQIK